MKPGFGSPQVLWSPQFGFAIRADRITCIGSTVYCLTLFLPAVSIVFTFKVVPPK